LETAIEVCDVSLPAVELSQGTGTAGLCVVPGLAARRHGAGLWGPAES